MCAVTARGLFHSLRIVEGEGACWAQLAHLHTLDSAPAEAYRCTRLAIDAYEKLGQLEALITLYQRLGAICL